MSMPISPVKKLDQPDSDRLDFIVLAAGAGTRFCNASPKPPKQFYKISGKAIISHCLEWLSSWQGCGHIILVLPESPLTIEMETIIGEAIANSPVMISTVIGGSSRDISALNGLRALRDSTPNRFVGIHDCARPFVPHHVLDALLGKLKQGAQAVVPALPVSDTIRQLGEDGHSHTLGRDDLRRMQTPQVFIRERITALHEDYAANIRAADKQATDKNDEDRQSLTDDAMLVERDGGMISFVTGDRRLEKVTYPEDISAMQGQSNQFETRTASGFDVHRFSDTTSGPIMICGVPVEHNKGVVAHSDGDVGLHALCDAILGALAIGDIGTYFPPSDQKWKEASSDQFIEFAARKVGDVGGRILHLDVTIICEKPHIGPYRLAMIDRIAGITQLSAGRVSVKATTSEKLGFTGRGEGIAALAQATLNLPANESDHNVSASEHIL